MEITVSANENTTTIAVAGSIDTNTAPQLEGAVNTALETSKSIVFDLAETEYISSAGLRVVLATQKAIAKAAGTFVLRNMQPNVREVFDVTGLSSVLTIE